MTRKVPVLIAGLGARAQLWMQLLSQHGAIEVAGLADPDPEARRKAANLFPARPVLADFAELAATVPAEAAVLITPPRGRAAQIDACLANGLHILAEKPLADSLPEAAGFVASAEAAERHLIVGLNFRYLAVTQAMRDILRTQRFGAPHMARFTYDRWRDGTLAHLNSYPLQMVHPMLWEQSIHHFDLMRYVYGREALRVYAQTRNPSWSMYRGDTNVVAMITFEGGLELTYQGSWQGGRAEIDFHWRTDCETGVVLQREMFGDLVTAGRMDDWRTEPLAQTTPWRDDAAALLEMFVGVLMGNRAPDCTGRDHLASMAILDAVIRSADSNMPVEVAPVGDLRAFELEKTQP